MSRDSLLSLEEKQTIANKYRAGDATQYDLAAEHGVSRRTIQRALMEMGVVHYNTKKPRIITDEEQEILTEVKKRGLNPTSLRRVFNQPSLTAGNVQLFLTQLSPVEFGNLVSVVGHQRVRRQAAQMAANQEQRRKAANEG